MLATAKAPEQTKQVDQLPLSPMMLKQKLPVEPSLPMLLPIPTHLATSRNTQDVPWPLR